MNSLFFFAKMSPKGFFILKNFLSKYLSMFITIAKINNTNFLLLICKIKFRNNLSETNKYT